MKRVIYLTVVFLLMLSGLVLAAEKDIHQELLLKVFQLEDSMLEDLFDSSFLETIPIHQLIDILNTFKDNLGSIVEVKATADGYTLVFENGHAPAALVTNDDQKITLFELNMWTLTGDTVAKVLAEVQDLAGSVSICIMKDNQEVLLDYNADTPMAVASSFKLYVLQAVYDAIQAGELSWDSLILLDRENISLPSGILQDWPEKAPVTIKTLTNLMISTSDNTAADHLIEYLGREKVEEYVSPITKPLLKTVEAFKIKYVLDSQLQERYIKGELAEKREFLNELRSVDLDVNIHEILPTPMLIQEVEWFFTTKELCQVIYSLKDADELVINPGYATKENWHLAGFKAGSEPGVLQSTHILQKTEADPIYTISVTINRTDDRVDSAAIVKLTYRLISLIENGQL